jgi:Zn ribbon nucleic-acid-binding protein
LQAIWPLLQALLFWEGDTVDLFGCQKCKQAECRSKSGLNETEQSNLAKEEKNQTPSLRRMLCGAMCPSLRCLHLCLRFGSVGWLLVTTIVAQDQLVVVTSCWIWHC